MKDLWCNYREILFNTFPELKLDTVWDHWEGKMMMDGNIYRGGYFLRTREAFVYNEKTQIYNHILYPLTGKNTPCFGMDLMGFSEDKVIIVFDFQHPVENHLFSVGDVLPKANESYRFFEMGNHFSEHIFVRKCKMDEVNNYLDIFAEYLNIYKQIVYTDAPFGYDTSYYRDFDDYMRRLDPIFGFMKNTFDEDKATQFVNNFLFVY